jgi:hypothetical protein
MLGARCLVLGARCVVLAGGLTLAASAQNGRGQPPPPAPVPPILQNYQAVTAGRLPTNSGILAPPASFLIDGKQYIAVEPGWGGDSRGMNAALNRLFPGEFPEMPEGGAVWAFALE